MKNIFPILFLTFLSAACTRQDLAVTPRTGENHLRPQSVLPGRAAVLLTEEAGREALASRPASQAVDKVSTA